MGGLIGSILNAVFGYDTVPDSLPALPPPAEIEETVSVRDQAEFRSLVLSRIFGRSME
jgi:hypothetical protein